MTVERSSVRTLVYGLGNPILTDDAVGIRVVERLQRMPGFSGVEFQTGSVGGLEVMEIILGYDRVFFVDAIKTKDGVPGMVYRFGLDDFRETARLSNIHDLSFLTAIRLAKRFEQPLPRNIDIIAIEILEDRVFAERMTPALEDRFESICSEVGLSIRQLLSA